MKRDTQVLHIRISNKVRKLLDEQLEADSLSLSQALQRVVMVYASGDLDLEYYFDQLWPSLKAELRSR